MWKGAWIVTFLVLPLSFSSFAQQRIDASQIPPQFNLDLTTAARLRPQLISGSVPADARYKIAVDVFDKLVEQVIPDSNSRTAWQVRIVEDGQYNAYSSPDGLVYVESGLANLAGPSAGLWAALLAHEIAHILHRDWARRYLFQKNLENESGSTIILGDPGGLSATWSDSNEASGELGRFCRQMELEADRESLMLMARAGFHPDFVASLYHLLAAIGTYRDCSSVNSMHPCWIERDRDLSQAYVSASIEFEHRWPEWFSSPGGNPPTVVFADEPKIKKTAAREWQISVPLRCQNLVGAVEVVLLSGPKGQAVPEWPPALSEGIEARELTGCTSPRTTVILQHAAFDAVQKSQHEWTQIYVLDAGGSVLAREDIPKFHR